MSLSSICKGNEAVNLPSPILDLVAFWPWCLCKGKNIGLFSDGKSSKLQANSSETKWDFPLHTWLFTVSRRVCLQRGGLVFKGINWTFFFLGDWTKEIKANKQNKTKQNLFPCKKNLTDKVPGAEMWNRYHQRTHREAFSMSVWFYSSVGCKAHMSFIQYVAPTRHTDLRCKGRSPNVFPAKNKLW